MAQALVLGMVDKAERKKSETSGLPECHLHCLDRSGKELTIVLPDREATRLYALLNVYVKR